jgi:RNA polymerase sigma factor (sigma-70 family)
MTSALLVKHDEIRRATPYDELSESANTPEQVESGRAKSGTGTSPESLRLRQILNMDIRYIHSPSFETPGAAKTICRPLPEVSSESDGKHCMGRPHTRAAVPPPGTPPYLAALYSIPLLTRDKERYLFRKMNFLKYRAGQLQRQFDPMRPHVEQFDQITQHLAEALCIRNQIISANLRLVVSIAKPLVDFANEFDEIISDGNVPLIRAVELFDFERGTRFGTYATWAVRNCLYRTTMRNRRHRRRFHTAADATRESLADHRTSIRASESYHRDMRQALGRMLERLDSRDQTIVSARFGLDGDRRPQKFREIAEKLNLSTERVRQLMARSLGRLSEMAAGNEPIEVA